MEQFKKTERKEGELFSDYMRRRADALFGKGNWEGLGALADPEREIEVAKSLEPIIIDLEPSDWGGRVRLHLSQTATQCLHLTRSLHAHNEACGDDKAKYEKLWEPVAEYMDTIWYDMTEDEKRAVEMYGSG